MDELIAFVRAQLDKDERVAAAASANDPDFGRWKAGSGIDECRVTGATMTIYDEGGHDEFQARHIARWDPARVLAEVEAKRRILDLCAPEVDEGTSGSRIARLTIHMLAQPYAGRTGWREEWAV